MNRWGRLSVLLALIPGTIIVALPSAAQAAPDKCTRCEEDVSGEGAVIRAAITRGKSDKVPNRGEAGVNGPAPGRVSWTTIEEYSTPACTNNGLFGPSDLCTNALNCPDADQVRYFIWHRGTAWEAGPPLTSSVGTWQREDGSFCLGPDDPGITPIGAVIAAVQRGFQDLPLPEFAPVIQPAPTTLVNIPTSFAAGSAEPITLTTAPLAGIVVTVVATPVEWLWTFGDGTTLVTTTPGRPGTDDVTHVYRRALTQGASVQVKWTGTFSLPGSAEQFPVRNPAFTQGPVTPVDVREARTELIDGS